MKTFMVAVSLLLISASAVDSKDQAAINYRKWGFYSSSSPDLSEEDCSIINTVVCKTCKKLGICRSDGNAGWNVADAGTCVEGETCLNGQCTTTINPKCSTLANETFLCTSSGVFPHPGDCQRYNFCVKDGDQLKHFEDSCSEGYAYNCRTALCDKKLPGLECTSDTVPKCTKFGDTDALEDCPSYYYTCFYHPSPQEEKVLYPLLQVCPNGQTYIPDFGCK